MKIAIDPGHGYRSPTSYDPGAVSGGREEARLVWDYALTLKFLLANAGVDVELTRPAFDKPSPLGGRARAMERAGCTHLISLHANAAANPTAHGVEVLYRDAGDMALAKRIQAELVRTTGFRDRGVKQRTDLAILKFTGTAVLVELGFLTHHGERERMHEKDHRIRTCEAIVRALGIRG